MTALIFALSVSLTGLSKQQSLLFSTNQFQPKEILTCIFTEPFFTIIYNSDTKEVTFVGVDTSQRLTEDFSKVTLTKNAQLIPIRDNVDHRYSSLSGQPLTAKDFQAVMGSRFELLDEKGDLILELILNFKGSDGIAKDLIFPFHAIHASGQIGACETTTVPAINTGELYRNLN